MVNSSPNYTTSQGITTIAPDVLISIARLTTLSVPGVSRLAIRQKDVNRVFRKLEQEGVDVTVEDNRVYVDVYVVLERDIIVRDVCHTIQKSIARAISEMVGMDVGRINIHVEDFDYALEEE